MRIRKSIHGRSPAPEVRGRRLLGTLALGALLASSPIAATDYIVTTVADIGVGSLRWAIDQANLDTGPDTILFDIAGSPPFVIAPTSPLPPITDAVLIDGFSQSMDGSVQVEISGANGFGSAIGLGALVSGVTIAGLSATDWLWGVYFSGGTVAGESSVVGSLLGVRPDGSAGPNSVGVAIGCGAGVIRVGGLTEGSGNVIAWNRLDGIRQRDDDEGCTGPSVEILGNSIGTDATGSVEMPNGQYGVWLDLDGPIAAIVGNGSMEGMNRIAFNGADGIYVSEARSRVSILSNSIHSNGGLAINLAESGDYVGVGSPISENDAAPDGDSNGGNELQNFPILSGAVPDGVGGTDVHVEFDSLAEQEFVLEIYANSLPDNTPDFFHSFHGEAKERVLVIDPVVTDGSGHWEDDVTVPGISPFLSATATHKASGNTSELSPFEPVFASTSTAAECTGEAIRLAAAACGANSPEELCRLELPGGCDSVETDVPLGFEDWTLFDGSSAPSGRFRYSCPTCFNAAGPLGDGVVLQHLEVAADPLFSDAISSSVPVRGFLAVELVVDPCDGGVSLTGFADSGVGFSETRDCSFYGLVAQESRRITFLHNLHSGDRAGAAHNVAFLRMIGSQCNGAGCLDVSESGSGTLPEDAGVTRSAFVTVRENDIATNDDLGVDLAPIGPNANDVGDPDDGPNRLQNFPEISTAIRVGDQLRATVALDSSPEGRFVVDLMFGDRCPANGRGGGIYVGSAVLETGASGLGSVNATVDLPTPLVGTVEYLTGIATSEEGNSSEMGTCTAVTVLPPDIFADDFESGDTSAWSSTQPPP